MRKLRIPALLLCFAVICVMLFSCAFIAAEAEHDCAGEHCEICLDLHICKELLKGLLCAPAVAAVVWAIAGAVRIVANHAAARRAVTLVSLNVQLLN